MSEEIDEVVTIAVMSNGDESIRTITNEYEQSDTCWPHLVEVFLEQLQGLGYKFFATPEEMVGSLEEYHQELMCAECKGCEEERPTVEEKKYPYIARHKVDTSHKIVFIAPRTGYTISSSEKRDINGFSQNWAEENFEKVSK